MSKGGKGGSGATIPSGSTTTTQQTAPWAGQQQFLASSGGSTPAVYNEAASLYNSYNPSYFPDSTVAPLNGAQTTALGQQEQLGAQGGSSAVGSANNALTNFNNGSFLSAGNPYFQDMAKTVAQTTAPLINSQFAANGRYGSGANVNAFASNLTNTLGNLAGQNYQQGMQNMLQSSAASPIVQAGQQSAIQGGLDAGGQQQQQSQAQLNDQVNRFNFAQQLPYNKLAAYQQMIQGNPGSSSTLTQPYFAQPSSGGGKSGGSKAASLIPIVAAAFLS